MNIALLAALGSIPFLFPYHAFPLITFEAEGCAFALALLFVAATFFGQKDHISMPPFLWPIFVLAGYVAIGAVRLPYWQVPIMAGAYILTAGMVSWASASTGKIGLTRVWLLRALAAGGFSMAIAGFLEHFGLATIFGGILTEQGSQGGMIGTLGQRNMFAAYVACGIVALLATRAHWAVLALTAVPMAFAEAFSGARVAWLFMWALPALHLVFFLLEKERWHEADALKGGLITACLFSAIRLTMADDLVIRPALDLAAAFAPPDATKNAADIALRVDFLKMAWRIWQDTPLFGTGFGEFAYQSFLHSTPGDATYAIERNAHNILAQILVEFGVIGAMLVGTALWLWKGKALENLDFTIIGEERALLILLAIVTIFSFTEFPLWHAQFLFLTAAVLGLLGHGRLLRTSESGAAAQNSMRFTAVAAATAGLVALSFIWSDYNRYKAFYRGEDTGVSFYSFFRPQLEFMVAQVLPPGEVPATVEQRLDERALHVYPKRELLCVYVGVLKRNGKPIEAMEVQRKVEIVYGKGACP